MRLIGLFLLLLGILLGFYAGFATLVSGILDIVNEIRADVVSPKNVGIGVAKILLCSMIGWIAAIVPALLGLHLLKGKV
jgi:hypothetical protein